MTGNFTIRNEIADYMKAYGDKLRMTRQTKLYARVIAPRTELPPLAAIYSNKVGEIVDAPDGRETGDSVWLKFSNGKIGQFYYEEVQLLTDEDAPEDDILISVGADENDIVWLSIPNPTKECEVIDYNG